MCVCMSHLLCGIGNILEPGIRQQIREYVCMYKCQYVSDLYPQHTTNNILIYEYVRYTQKSRKSIFL